MRERLEEFSPLERKALGLWTAEAPPAGFADRVLADLTVDLGGEGQRAGRRENRNPGRRAGHPAAHGSRPDRAPVPTRGKGLAAAAAALLLLGGIWSLRGFSLHGIGHTGGASPSSERAFVGGHDAAEGDGDRGGDGNGDGGRPTIDEGSLSRDGVGGGGRGEAKPS